MKTADLIGFDNITLKGDPLSRAKAALRIARQQVRLASADTDSWRLEAVLASIEDDLGVHLHKIDNAQEDDAAALVESDPVLLQAWLPLRAA
jgi:hypothetical protein